jgi:hypothetical protein
MGAVVGFVCEALQVIWIRSLLAHAYAFVQTEPVRLFA